jgi:hypothetical protein
MDLRQVAVAVGMIETGTMIAMTAPQEMTADHPGKVEIEIVLK